METKICSKCGKELPVNMFNKNKANIGGFCGKCKDCEKIYKKEYKEKHNDKIIKGNKIYRENNLEKLKEYSRQYYQDNKEKIKENAKIYRDIKRGKPSDRIYYKSKEERQIARRKQSRQYRAENLEKFLEREKRYRDTHKEEVNKRSKAYMESHKEEVLEHKRKYRKDNRDKCNIYDQKRRAKKLKLPHTLTSQQWTDIKNRFDNKCCYCGRELPLEQEHFIPLSKGGEFTTNNIIPACKSCNSSKHNYEFFEWYPKQSFYSKAREARILKYLNYKGNVQQLKII